MTPVLPCLSLACTLMLAAPSFAQAPATPAPDSRPRVFVADSNSWETRGGGGGSSRGFGGASSGGARPQTAEIIKTLGERCPQVLVNSRPEVSQYVLRLDHEGGKSVLRKDNKVAVFVQKTGDSIFSASTHSLGASVQEACAAITTHWAQHASELAASPGPDTAAPPAPAPGPTAPPQSVAPGPAAPVMATLQIDSNVPGADIEIDGAFAGNTPSTLTVPAGQHTITVKKKNYPDWTRTLNVSGTNVHLNAELTQAK